MAITKKTATVAEIATLLKAQVKGSHEREITAVAGLSDASCHDIVFFSSERYLSQLADCGAGAIITMPQYVNDCPAAASLLIVDNPQRAWLQLLHFLYPAPHAKVGIHPTAIIPASCRIEPTASIGPYCVLGERVIVGAGSSIAAGCTLADDVKLGHSCQLDPRVMLYDAVRCGDRVRLHAGVVIGADGFGNHKDEHNHWQKIPQLGSVVIGDDVEIGANTTVDCGALKDSVIEDGVRIDNMVYLAHNVTVGAHTAIAAGTIVAGTVLIGKHCLIGGGCSIAGHLTIVDHVVITATSSVSKSIKQAGAYSSGQPTQPRQSWHKSVVHYRNLDTIVKRIKNLEKKTHEQNTVATVE